MFLLCLIFAGVQRSTTSTSPRSCPPGQFSCPPPDGCIQVELRCDGIPHCLRGEDENGCHPHDNFTTQSDRCNHRNNTIVIPWKSHVVVLVTWKVQNKFLLFSRFSLVCWNLRPHPPTPAPLRTPSMAGVTKPSLTTSVRQLISYYLLLHVWFGISVLLWMLI